MPLVPVLRRLQVAFQVAQVAAPLLPIVVQGRDHRVNALIGSNDALITQQLKSRPGTVMESNEKH
jgi:hypothetical protein